MTPEAGLITQIGGMLIDKLGTTPILLFFILIILGPWIANVWITHQQNKRDALNRAQQSQSFDEFIKRYEANVQLVKAYEVVASNYHEITNNLQELVMITTQTMEKLVGKIENNRYCPIVKQTLNGTVIVEGRQHE